MNFDDLAKLTDQLLSELPTTPVSTDAVSDGSTIAGLWSGLMTVHHSRASVLFENPVVCVAIVRHWRTATILNEQVDAAACVGRRNIRMARNTWEAVLQVTVTRRDWHRQVSDLALQQMLELSSALVVDVTLEQQRHSLSLLNISCPATVPITALQALRLYRDRVLGLLMTWPFISLPDIGESFPCIAQNESSECAPDEVAELAEVSPPELSKPKLSLPDIRLCLANAVIGQGDSVRAFAACAYRHLQGIRQGAILTSGPSGVGKTSLASAIRLRVNENRRRTLT